MTQAAYPLAKRVEEALLQAKLISTGEGSPSFPWQEVSSQLSKLFQVKNFGILGQKQAWLDEEKLLLGMGEKPSIYSFVLTPLPANGYFVMAQEDVTKLTSYLLTKDHSFKGFSDRSLKEGFFLFLLLRSMQLIDAMHPFGDLSPKFSSLTSLPMEGAYSLDISIELNSLKLWARLLYPKEFKEEFVNHFKKYKPSLLTDEMTRQIEAPLHLEVGSSYLKSTEWQQISAGDFIVLDRCTAALQTGKGSGILILAKTPLFQVRIRDEGVKIVDYAFYQEETSGEMVQEEEAAPVSLESGSVDDELTINPPDEPLWGTTPQESSSEPGMTLTVEMGKMRMGVDRILQLKPDDFLEFPISKEHAVALCIDGRKVGEGELMKLGDVLGVRVLVLT